MSSRPSCAGRSCSMRAPSWSIRAPGSAPSSRSLALAAGGFAVRPALLFVGIDRRDQLSVLGLFGRALSAAIKLVGPFHEQRVHLVRHAGEMCNRLGRARPYSVIARVAEFFHRLDGRLRLPTGGAHGNPSLAFRFGANDKVIRSKSTAAGWAFPRFAHQQTPFKKSMAGSGDSNSYGAGSGIIGRAGTRTCDQPIAVFCDRG